MTDDATFADAGAEFFRPPSAVKPGGARTKGSIFDDIVAESPDDDDGNDNMGSDLDEDLRPSDSASNVGALRPSRRQHRSHDDRNDRRRRRGRSPSIIPAPTGPIGTPGKDEAVARGSSMVGAPLARQSPPQQREPEPSRRFGHWITTTLDGARRVSNQTISDSLGGMSRGRRKSP